MLISFEWLKEFINLEGITPEDLADKMSRTGIEVEDVVRPSDGLKKIVVGEVVECVDHPNSDHLHICQVNIGDEVTQIVCGAPNVATGQKVIVALPGARIVDNIKIKKGKMRGEASNGMLCGLDEIGIPESVVPKAYADGIYILPGDATPGESVFGILGMNDALLDLAITPNRADALSIHGASYEVGAIYDRSVSIPELSLETVSGSTENFVKATVEVEDMVPTYGLRYLKNIHVQESPQWMQNRLMHAGIRPVNNIVDATNYIMLEYGQPLHAYDAEKIKHLTVRFAKQDETMVTLDGEERQLITEDLVIENEGEIVALAGVMGSEAVEVTEKTTDIILEAAIFDPVHIRRTSQYHNLRTDASTRFEKGINQSDTLVALDAAAQMIVNLANASMIEEPLIATQFIPEIKEVSTSLSRVNHLLGSQLTKEDIHKVFEALSFDLEWNNENDFTVSIPPRRWDIDIEADLVEEIIRIYGYQHLESRLPQSSTIGILTKEQQLERFTRKKLEALGLQEAISYALLTEEEANRFAMKHGEAVNLDLPMSQDHAYLRRNLIQGLLKDIGYNVARKNNHVAFYEMGTVFDKQSEGLPKESFHVAMAMTGQQLEDTWNQRGETVDFFTLKGIVENWLSTLSFAEAVNFVPTTDYDMMHPGRTAAVYVGEHLVGFLGQLHPEMEQQLDLTNTYVAEFDLDILFSLERTGITFEEVSKFPSVTRDIALLIDERIENIAIVTAIKSAGGRFLQSVKLFDNYQGENIEPNKKSLAYQLTFQDKEATLTDELIEKTMEKITKVLQEKFNSIIR